MKILSIDDLAKSTEHELSAAVEQLRIAERVKRVIANQASTPRLTLEEYNSIVDNTKPVPCKVCNGTGLFTPPAPRKCGVLHPSSAHMCVLRMYYDIKGVMQNTPAISYELALTFAIGHAIHEMVQNAISTFWDSSQFVPEADVDMGLIHGHTDGLITLDNVRAVLEIKTMGAEYDSLTKPKPEHILQAMGLYSTALDAPFTVFLYVSKKYPHPIKEYILPYDPDIYDRWWRKKGEKVFRAVEENDEPVADAEPAECAQCGYKKVCAQMADKKAMARFRR